MLPGEASLLNQTVVGGEIPQLFVERLNLQYYGWTTLTVPASIVFLAPPVSVELAFTITNGTSHADILARRSGRVNPLENLDQSLNPHARLPRGWGGDEGYGYRNFRPVLASQG